MNLLVIRHGQSEADILHVIEGRADFNLTDLGRDQARLMAQWVSANHKIDRIVSSTLKRAKQTAQYLSEAAGVSLDFDDDLMEFQNGLIAGLSREEANQRYPLPSLRHPHTALHEQESLIHFRMRAETALSKIIHENPVESTIAIVSHGGMINMLFRSFLELPTNAAACLSSGDTAVHLWQIRDGIRRVVFANYQGHLTPRA